MKKRPKLSKQLRRKFVSREEYNILAEYCKHLANAVNELNGEFRHHNHGNVRVTLGKTTEHKQD